MPSMEPVAQALGRFLLAPTWNDSRRVVEAHPELITIGVMMIDQLLSDPTAAFPHLSRPRAEARLKTHRRVLVRCGEVGVARAFDEIGGQGGSQQHRAGLGAVGVLGIAGVLAIIGVVIWIIVAHHKSGYPPSQTFHDPTDTSGQRSINEIAFSPNGKKLITADAYTGANLLRLNDGRLVHSFPTDTGDPDSVVTRAAFSPNGHLLAYGDYNGTVFLWSITSRHRIAKFPDPMANGFDSANSGGVYGLSFSPDGRILAAAEFDGKVHLWDVNSRKMLTTLHVSNNESGGLVGYLSFSPNGHVLAVGDANGKAYVWNVARSRRIAVLSYPHSSTTGIIGVAFSPNGRLLATLETDGTAVMWDTSTWKQAGTLSVGDSNSNDNCSIAFSPTGKTLAAGCNGANTYLWDVASKQQIATLTCPSGSVTGDAFSPDGNTIAAGTDTGYICLWNVRKVGGNK